MQSWMANGFNRARRDRRIRKSAEWKVLVIDPRRTEVASTQTCTFSYGQQRRYLLGAILSLIVRQVAKREISRAAHDRI
jgi:hypothetical protein